MGGRTASVFSLSRRHPIASLSHSLYHISLLQLHLFVSPPPPPNNPSSAFPSLFLCHPVPPSFLYHPVAPSYAPPPSLLRLCTPSSSVSPLLCRREDLLHPSFLRLSLSLPFHPCHLHLIPPSLFLYHHIDAQEGGHIAYMSFRFLFCHPIAMQGKTYSLTSLCCSLCHTSLPHIHFFLYHPVPPSFLYHHIAPSFAPPPSLLRLCTPSSSASPLLCRKEDLLHPSFLCLSLSLPCHPSHLHLIPPSFVFPHLSFFSILSTFAPSFASPYLSSSTANLTSVPQLCALLLDCLLTFVLLLSLLNRLPAPLLHPSAFPSTTLLMYKSEGGHTIFIPPSPLPDVPLFLTLLLPTYIPLCRSSTTATLTSVSQLCALLLDCLFTSVLLLPLLNRLPAPLLLHPSAFPSTTLLMCKREGGPTIFLPPSPLPDVPLFLTLLSTTCLPPSLRLTPLSPTCLPPSIRLYMPLPHSFVLYLTQSFSLRLSLILRAFVSLLRLSVVVQERGPTASPFPSPLSVTPLPSFPPPSFVFPLLSFFSILSMFAPSFVPSFASPCLSSSTATLTSVPQLCAFLLDCLFNSVLLLPLLNRLPAPLLLHSTPSVFPSTNPLICKREGEPTIFLPPSPLPDVPLFLTLLSPTCLPPSLRLTPLSLTCLPPSLRHYMPLPYSFVLYLTLSSSLLTPLPSFPPPPHSSLLCLPPPFFLLNPFRICSLLCSLLRLSLPLFLHRLPLFLPAPPLFLTPLSPTCLPTSLCLSPPFFLLNPFRICSLLCFLLRLSLPLFLHRLPPILPDAPLFITPLSPTCLPPSFRSTCLFTTLSSFTSLSPSPFASHSFFVPFFPFFASPLLCRR